MCVSCGASAICALTWSVYACHPRRWGRRDPPRAIVALSSFQHPDVFLARLLLLSWRRHRLPPGPSRMVFDAQEEAWTAASVDGGRSFAGDQASTDRSVLSVSSRTPMAHRGLQGLRLRGTKIERFDCRWRCEG